MKKALYGFLAVAAMVSFTACSSDAEVVEEVVEEEAAFQDYELVNDESTIEWIGTWVGGESDGKVHNGTVSVTEGELHLEGGVYSGGFVVDMTTINNLDIEDETYKTKLEGHLKAPDYFNTEEFPITKVAVEGVNFEEANIRVHALGLAIERTVPIKATFDGDNVSLTGEFEIDFEEAKMPGTQLNPEAPENGSVSSKVKFKVNVVLVKK